MYIDEMLIVVLCLWSSCRVKMGEGGMDALIALGGGDMRRSLNIVQVGNSAVTKTEVNTAAPFLVLHRMHASALLMVCTSFVVIEENIAAPCFTLTQLEIGYQHFSRCKLHMSISKKRNSRYTNLAVWLA